MPRHTQYRPFSQGMPPGRITRRIVTVTDPQGGRQALLTEYKHTYQASDQVVYTDHLVDHHALDDGGVTDDPRRVLWCPTCVRSVATASHVFLCDWCGGRHCRFCATEVEWDEDIWLQLCPLCVEVWTDESLWPRITDWLTNQLRRWGRSP